MKEKSFHESLELLKEVRRDLSLDAQGRVLERLDEVIDRMQRARDDGSYRSIPPGELLDALSRIIAASGRFAALVDTILKSL
jgi:hypothetical protein